MKLVTTVGLILIASHCFATSTNHPHFSGSFVQDFLADSWTTNRWAEEFQYMQAVRINTLILQWVVDSGKKTADYPTDMPGYTQVTKHDIIENALTIADKYNSKVIIGLNYDDAWWDNFVLNREWFLNTMSIATNALQEIWTHYGHHNSLAGWYIVHEPWNQILDTQSLSNLIDGLNIVVNYAHQFTRLPVAIAPFYNSSKHYQTASQFGATWNTILNNVKIDIVALQDGMGSGHSKRTKLPLWYSEMHYAIAASTNAARFFCDTETFVGNRPMSVSRYAGDMVVESLYVDGFWSFSFNHFISPQQVPPHYYKKYFKWVNN